MTDEIFKEAKQLYEDINTLKYHLEQVKKRNVGLQLQFHFMREMFISEKISKRIS